MDVSPEATVCEVAQTIQQREKISQFNKLIVEGSTEIWHPYLPVRDWAVADVLTVATQGEPIGSSRELVFGSHWRFSYSSVCSVCFCRCIGLEIHKLGDPEALRLWNAQYVQQ
jgi:hypothetical protein